MGIEMPKFAAPKTNDYLERHLEPTPPENKESGFEEKYPESVRRLFNPNIKYEKSGQERVELNNDWLLEYTYEEAGDEQFGSSTDDAYEKYVLRQPKSAGWRRLTNLSIKGPTDQGFNLMKDFKVRDIFFSIRERNGQARFKKGKIYSDTSPNSFLGIMAIMHEIGHAEVRSKDYDNLDKADDIASSLAVLKSSTKKLLARKILGAPFLNYFLPKTVNRFAGEEVLKNERDAWAVAVASLRSTLEAFGVSPKDFKEAIHKDALASYSDHIRQRL